MTPIQTSRLIVVSVAVITLSSCGYALAGRGSTLPAHVRVIGIPQFTNQSSVPDADRVFTEHVRNEFRSRGRYRIVTEEAGADAVLIGTVTSATLTPTAFAAGTRQASAYAIIATANIEFKDLKDKKTLWANPAMQAREEYEVPTGQVINDPTAFFRQDANALDRLARTFARTVVTSILEAF